MTKQFYDFTDRDINRHQAKIAHVLGICPKCGDAGWWIDDHNEPLTASSFHYCDCSFGIAAREKDAREDAEAEAEAEREQEAKEQQAREEETPSGQQQYARLWPVSGR